MSNLTYTGENFKNMALLSLIFAITPFKKPSMLLTVSQKYAIVLELAQTMLR